MSPRAFDRWRWTHKWSSLICTVFLLWLCLTGLPLIFHHEIEDLLDGAAAPSDGPRASLEQVLASVRQQHPAAAVQYLVWPIDDADRLTVVTAPSVDADPASGQSVNLDTTGRVLPEGAGHAMIDVVLRLHVDLYAGLAGKLFLGCTGLLFVAAIVSGVAVYGPFMRRLPFGTVRRGRSARVTWLDLHNLLGIVTVAWAVVVGLTGALNTCADLVVALWRADQLAAMVAPYRDAPPPTALVPVDRAVDAARAAAPGMTPAFVAFPGTQLSSRHHYAVFLRGDTPLTARLLKPALIDAATGTLTELRELPWYVTTLLLSQPLHFGDYGGLPLKIIWALLDLVTIFVLGSGLYLWLRRGVPLDAADQVVA